MGDLLLYFGGFLLIMCALFVAATFLGAIVRARASADWITLVLRKRSGIGGNIIAATVGVITPFCSCTTVPIFAGLLASDVSLGVAVSFLIASPTMNIAAFVLLLTLFGVKAAVFYLASCMAIAVAVGGILGRMKLKDYINHGFANFADSCHVDSWKDTLRISLAGLKYFAPILALSAAIGAVIHNYLPTELVTALSGNNSIFAIPVATAIGAVIYADVIVVLPVGYALLQKGLNQGIVFAFMIAAAGISLPSVLLLAKILAPRLLLFLVGLLLVFYMLLGVAYYYM